MRSALRAALLAAFQDRSAAPPPSSPSPGEPLPPSAWSTSSWIGLALALTIFAAAAALLLRPPARRRDAA